MSEIFLVRYHTSPTEIRNYDFIYQLDAEWRIKKTLAESLPYKCCNVDTIGQFKEEGSVVKSIMFGHGDVPDMLTVEKDSKEYTFKLHRCHKESQVTFMTREQILAIANKVIANDPLLSLILD